MKRILLMCFILSLSACDQEKPREFVLVGDNWQAITELQGQGIKVAVEPKQGDVVAIGDRLRWQVTASQTGRLWVLSVDENDEVSLIYPNSVASDNAIMANSPRLIPAETAQWDIEVGEPKGKIQLAFVVTPADMTLGQVLPATMANNITTPPSTQKAIRLNQGSGSQQWGVNQTVITVN